MQTIRKTEVIEQIKKIMKRKIGREHAIRQETLIELIWGTPKTIYEKEYNRKTLKDLCRKLRKYTNYFIRSELSRGKVIMYIMHNRTELRGYENIMEKTITGCGKMTTRAREHIREARWKKLS